MTFSSDATLHRPTEETKKDSEQLAIGQTGSYRQPFQLAKIALNDQRFKTWKRHRVATVTLQTGVASRHREDNSGVLCFLRTRRQPSPPRVEHAHFQAHKRSCQSGRWSSWRVVGNPSL